MLSVIVNVNLEIKTPKTTTEKASLFAQNYELPKEYIEDSYEEVKIINTETEETVE